MAAYRFRSHMNYGENLNLMALDYVNITGVLISP